MASSSALKQVRLEARLTREQKELFERAAALRGTTLTEFVLSSARLAAEQAIHEHDILTLTARESRAFIDALQNPPEPNAALRAAAEHYARVMGSA